MTDDRVTALEAAIAELQEVRHNLVLATGAQGLALTILLRFLVTKGVTSAEEINRLFLGALALLPESEQQGVVGRTLRKLADAGAAAVAPNMTDPTRH